ncbi:ABC transporter ATP-binding protein [Lacticaseibacillus paracasei]|uniref:ABC transporter ATP-binding protein n=1 Tax=Lacticaseibacillus paracasei TaxID=1597 RepID=UPI000D389EC4|nr:ABC transporter ATP-binding protein [Lacticaseibacillus paracasei]PTS55552.1 sodium ABC transporter ATP-binding protein [Lactobacillus sp. DS22_6]MBS6631497.1 ABC transporter ATP-binding protein [Lacticaseibacillus paracasei]MBX4166880.1 ABC transporter ATP-binding protein [Lacticaseibacillus paracasei]MCZ2753397.1 ABC transporter ATP-binding protein [Lacticaseibacillus paracasei]MCZ2763838.1 ABC transporter ATP-binding protein [Lacticaseibacillus paracasei]
MLTVTGLTKRFGSATAVHDVSFTIQPGEILSLIGQNGAGKTTTFRMLLNLLQADHGNMTWNDQPLSLLSRETIGYLPEERGLYPKMTVVDQICFFGELHGMKRAAVMAVLDQWLDQFQVKGKPTDLVKDLSKGNQQKVQLIAAMIHNPQFIILDEPFSGLDPVNAGLLEAGIRRLRDAGSAIIYSSHDMGNVEAISDKLVMLKNGEVVLSGALNDIRDQFGQTRLYIQSPLTQEQLLSFPGVVGVAQRSRGFLVKLAEPQAGHDIFTAATQQGYIPEFSQQAPSLDEIFRMKVEA